MTPEGEGWGYLPNTAKAHYFADGHRSICGKWMTLGSPIWESNQTLGVKPDRGTCAACWKRRAKQKAVIP